MYIVGKKKRVKISSFSLSSLGGSKSTIQKKFEEMTLKIYVDRMSQPSRALILFCKINGIDFEEITIELKDNQQYTPEYKAINPMCKIPTIVDGDFTLFESHAILIYLACKFPGVASHWYPSDLIDRAKVHSVLDWHHSNLRSGSVGLLMLTTFGPVLSGIPLDHEAIEEAEKKLAKALSMIEDYWLKDGKFLVGRSQPSIADLLLVSDLLELVLLNDKDHERIFSPYTKVVKWIEDTKSVMAPYFDEVHKKLFKSKITFQEQLAARSGK